MTGTVRDARKRELVVLRSQEAILRGSARSSGAENPQVVQVAARNHLDARWQAPVVVDGEIVVHPQPYRSPLDADPVTGQWPTVLRGGPVHDVGEVARIAARVEHAERAERRRVARRNWWGWRR